MPHRLPNPRLCAPWILLGGLLLATPGFARPPAAVAPGGAEFVRAETSFDQFARRWMQKMERAEAGNRAKARPQKGGRIVFRGYGGAVKTRLRATGHAEVPYVGVLEYAEERMSCEGARGGRCRVAHSTPVTEIFRYQDGRWVY